MTTYYVVRRGWNSANQSSVGSARNPKNTFESRLDFYLGTVEAGSEDDAKQKAAELWSCYPNQFFHAYANPRRLAGLLAEVRRGDQATLEMRPAGTFVEGAVMPLG